MTDKGCSEMTIQVSELRQEAKEDSHDLIARVCFKGRTRDVVFSRFSSESQLFESEPSFDPFLILLLLPAMRVGEAIEIEGEVDDLLLYRVQTLIQDLLQDNVPNLQTVEIHAQARKRGLKQVRSHVATGFSGGVDSMHLLDAAIFRKCVPDEMRVSLLVHNGLGSVTDRGQFENNLQHTRQWAEALQVEYAGANCDVEDYYSGLSFAVSHHLRNVAAALSIAHLHESYLYCSSMDLRTSARINQSKSLNHVEGHLLPMFNTKQNRFHSFGSEHPRIEKISQVMANLNLAMGLNVCARPNHDNSRFINCGRCYKCFPVLLAISEFGDLKSYKEHFDLDSFQKLYVRCMLNMFWRGSRHQGNQFVRHTFRMLRHSKLHQPWWVRFLSKFVPEPLVKSDLNRLRSIAKANHVPPSET